MQQVLEEIKNELEKIIDQLHSHVKDGNSFGLAHNNWAFPGLTRDELMENAESIIDMIDSSESAELGDSEDRIRDYVRRLTHLRQSTIPNLWGNPSQAVAAYIFTLDGLRTCLTPVLVRDDRAQNIATQKKIRDQLRGMQAELNRLEPRIAPLASIIERIEQAYSAAEQLPADLKSLAEAREEIADFAKKAKEDHTHLTEIRGRANELDRQLNKSAVKLHTQQRRV